MAEDAKHALSMVEETKHVAEERSQRQNCYTIQEFADLAGLDLSTIPSLPDQEFKMDVSDMTHSIMKTTYCESPILALLCETTYKRKTIRDVLMLQFAPMYYRLMHPESIFTMSSNDINHYVNNHHNDSPFHTGKSIDVCDNCFLINDWWRIPDLISILNNTNPYVKLVKPSTV